MARHTFTWDENTKWEDMPKWLANLIPSTADFDRLDAENQFEHIRFRVMHEIDITEQVERDIEAIEYEFMPEGVKFAEWSTVANTVRWARELRAKANRLGRRGAKNV